MSERGNAWDMHPKLWTVVTDWGGAKAMKGEGEKRCLDLFQILVKKKKKKKSSKVMVKVTWNERQQKQESL